MCYGFFFAQNFDLTLNEQRKVDLLKTQRQGGPSPPKSQLAGDMRYMWNQELYRDLVAQELPAYWTTPLIQGYVDMQELANGSIKMITIARR
jgi:hypothetical protein